MSQAHPQWLTIEFLKECLQNEEKYRKATISRFEVFPAAPEGNNYGSIVLRVKIEYTENSDVDEVHSLSVIMKGPVTTGKIGELFSYLAGQEPIFYYRYLPEVYKLYNYSFAPTSFFSPLSSVVVMEDLKTQGYLMADRIKQLDFDHCKLYMIAAASFHAGSVGVYQRNPEVINSIGSQKMFSHDLTSSAMSKRMTKIGLECFANHIPNKRHSKLVRDIADSVWDALVETHKPCELLNTLNQGDPWTTNMMFRYEKSGKASDIKLLDFQVPMYTTPLHDVVFFIWTSAQHDVRRHRFEELYRIYFEHFNKVMKQLECTEALTYENFLAEAKRMTPMILWILSFISYVLNPSATDIDLLYSKVEQYDGNAENPYEVYYTQSFCQDHLPQFLEELELLGVFDYLENLQKS